MPIGCCSASQTHIGGFLNINEARLRLLPAEALKRLIEGSDALGLAYAQLLSMSNQPKLLEAPAADAPQSADQACPAGASLLPDRRCSPALRTAQPDRAEPGQSLPIHPANDSGWCCGFEQVPSNGRVFSSAIRKVTTDIYRPPSTVGLAS